MWVDILKPEYSVALRERAINTYLSRNEKALIVAESKLEKLRQKSADLGTSPLRQETTMNHWFMCLSEINEEITLAAAEVRKWESMETDVEKLYQTPDFKWFLNDFEMNNFCPSARDYDSVWVSEVYGRNRVIQEGSDPQDAPKIDESDVQVRDIVEEN